MFFRTGESENDQDFTMCGTWRHGTGHRTLEFNLTQGCGDLDISADENTLSIRGAITASSQSVNHIQLNATQRDLSPFCVFWEPLVDQLRVEVDGQNHSLLKAAGLQEVCCTDLSRGHQSSIQMYGIVNGSVRGDALTYDTRGTFGFYGQKINCSECIAQLVDRD